MRKCTDCGKDDLSKRLNKRATILQPSTQTGAYNVPTGDPITVATVWAAVEPLRGREYFAAAAEHAEVTTRIRIRWRPGIDRTMTVRCDGAEFEILHIIDPGFAHKELQLMCKERQ